MRENYNIDGHTTMIFKPTVGDPPPFTPGQIAGITIGVLVFVAIVVPLLVIILDENKKRATIAKLNAAKARIARIRCPRPRCPKLSCPRLPRRQPRRSAPEPITEPSTVEPLHPEPSNSGPSNQDHIAAPQVPQESPVAENPQNPSHFSKLDEPPPYPGGPVSAYPGPPAYQGYPPPGWRDPAYPPAAEPAPS